MEKIGVIPSNVTLESWFKFLLRQGVRPYQQSVYSEKRIHTVGFPERGPFSSKARNFISKSNVKGYYFLSPGVVAADRISDLVTVCNEKSGGLVINRLERMFSSVLIDEVQDLAGYDLDILELLFKSKLDVLAVGDHRQVIYRTNDSTRNKQFRDERIIAFFKMLEEKGLCTIEYRNESFRCNQYICDFADRLFPGMDRTESRNLTTTGHDGIFTVQVENLQQYVDQFRPRVLRNSKSAKTGKFEGLNFGQSKGQTFDRTLIFPTEPILKYLKTGKIEDAGNLPRFYVALTRARYSVAIVCKFRSAISGVTHY